MTIGLTTVDNPFDLFKDFANWLSFDMQKGYNTQQLLNRVAGDVGDLDEKHQNRVLEEAIDSIIELNITEIQYKKVFSDSGEA